MIWFQLRMLGDANTFRVHSGHGLIIKIAQVVLHDGNEPDLSIAPTGLVIPPAERRIVPIVLPARIVPEQS